MTSRARIAFARSRYPADVIRALPLAPRERTLHASECSAGCRLVATRHGVWEWPAGGAPTRLCWRAISSISYGAGRLVVRTHDGPARPCEHRVDPSDGFIDLLRVMDRGSRTVDFSVRLSSGRPARVQARYCGFDDAVSWRVAVGPGVATDGDRDASEARAHLASARRDHGHVADHWWGDRWY